MRVTISYLPPKFKLARSRIRQLTAAPNQMSGFQFAILHSNLSQFMLFCFNDWVHGSCSSGTR